MDWRYSYRHRCYPGRYRRHGLRDVFGQAHGRAVGPLYSIAVIGEAAKNIDSEVRAAYPGIPWRAIAGMRDRIVHEYLRTNTRRIWDVVTDDIEPLKNTLRDALNRRPPSP